MADERRAAEFQQCRVCQVDDGSTDHYMLADVPFFLSDLTHCIKCNQTGDFSFKLMDWGREHVFVVPLDMDWEHYCETCAFATFELKPCHRGYHTVEWLAENPGAVEASQRMFYFKREQPLIRVPTKRAL